jgi:hypothetical protein
VTVMYDAAVFAKKKKFLRINGVGSSVLKTLSPYSLLLNGCRGLVPWALSGRSVKLTTHLHLVLRSGVRGAIPSLPQYVFMAWRLVKHRDKFTYAFVFTLNKEHIFQIISVGIIILNIS